MIEKIKNKIILDLSKMSKTDKTIMLGAICFSILFFISCVFTALFNSNLKATINSITLDIKQIENDKISLSSDQNILATLEEEKIDIITQSEDTNIEQSENNNKESQYYYTSSSNENYNISNTNNYTESNTQNTNEETVWIGETGTKYHRYTCGTLRGNKYEITLQEAMNQGREPCKVCKP